MGSTEITLTDESFKRTITHYLIDQNVKKRLFCRTVLQPLTLFLLFLTGLVAGFVDSIAGGGGLITLPVMLSLPISPQVALGTNKLQSTFGSGSATLHFWQARLVVMSECIVGIVLTIIGALLGTWLVQHINPSFLKQFIPILLIAVALVMIFKPKLGESDTKPRLSPGTFYVLFGLTLGFYDGFIGPGTGTFWTMALIAGLGLGLQKATAHTKVMNFASNIASLGFFIYAGQVAWAPGFVMGIGQLLGAKLGSHMVVTRGTKFIRPLFLTMVFLLTARLLWVNHNTPPVAQPIGKSSAIRNLTPHPPNC